MRRWIGLPLIIAMCALAAACGGGGGDGTGDGSNLDPQLTDPATVPTAEPVDGQLVYQIRDGIPNAPDGAVATPSDPDGSEGGGATGGYTVVGGDTCSSIADKLGISTPDLLADNPTINDGCTNLQPGDVLAVPGGGSGGSDDEPDDDDGDGGGSVDPTATTAPSGNVHVVGAGDTCFDIAANQGVTTDEIIAANPGLNCSALQLGQEIAIP